MDGATEGSGVIEVIGVEPGDHIATGDAKPLVDRGGRAVVGFRDDGVDGIAVAIDDVHGSVMAGSIHDDVLQIDAGFALLEDASDGLFQKAFPIEVGGDDADSHMLIFALRLSAPVTGHRWVML